MKLLKIAPFVICMATTAQAQDDLALREAALRYVNDPVQQEMMDAMSTPEAFIAQLRATLPNASQEELDLAAEILAEEITTLRPVMEAAMVEAAVTNFSLEEITALNAFYATPEGASVMRKMQGFMAAFWEMVGLDLQQTQMRAGARIGEALGNR